MYCVPVNRPLNARRQTPLTGREIRGDAGGIIPVYRKTHWAAVCGSGDSVAAIGVSRASCHIGVSNSIPVLLPPLQDSASYGSGQNAGGPADVMIARVEAATVNSPSLIRGSGGSAEGVHTAIQRAHEHHAAGDGVGRDAVEVALPELPYLFACCRPQSPE